MDNNTSLTHVLPKKSYLLIYVKVIDEKVKGSRKDPMQDIRNIRNKDKYFVIKLLA